MNDPNLLRAALEKTVDDGLKRLQRVVLLEE
jgi:hypothetical protein